VREMVFDGSSGKPIGLEKLHRDFGTSCSLALFSDYTVKNLALVVLRAQDSIVEVRFRPTVVGDVALAGAMYWIGDYRPERTLLCHFDDNTNAWRHSVGGRWDRTLNRISYLVSAAKAQASKAVVTKELSPEQLPRNSCLSKALSQWKAASGFYERSAFHVLLGATLENRYVVCSTPRRSQDFIISAVGSGLPRFAHEWLSRTIGKRAQDQPDSHYGQSCVNTYLQVLERNQPLLEDVDAIANWPDYGPTRRRYRRLILPFRDEKGVTRMLSATLPDSDIDLRKMAT
jgi:hypothetical protein